MKTWIIADTHLGHEELSELAGRPADFTSQILHAIARHVSDHDTLIHLGDVCFGQDSRWVYELTMKMPLAQRILVRGNHDKKSTHFYLQHGFNFVCDSFESTYYGKRLRFSHAPESRCPGVDYQLHGHTHGNAHRDEEHAPFYDPAYHIEVALEKTGYKPLLLEHILKEHKAI